MCYNNSTWTDIVARFKIDAAEFLADHIEDIMRDIRNTDIVDEVLLSLSCYTPAYNNSNHCGSFSQSHWVLNYEIRTCLSEV